MKTSVVALLVLFQANAAFALDSPVDNATQSPAPVIRELPLPEAARLRAGPVGEAFVTLTHQGSGYLLQRWLPAKQAEATHQKAIPLNERDTDWWMEAVSPDANQVLIDTCSDTYTPYLLYNFLTDTLIRVDHGPSFAGALASFSPDGRYLALASTIGDTLYVQVLDTTSGKPATEPFKHGEDYLDDSGIPGLALLQFAPDSKSIISQGRYLARQWTIEDNTNVLTYVTGWDTREHDVFVESLMHPTVGRLFSKLIRDEDKTTPEPRVASPSALGAPVKNESKNCLLLDLETQLPRLFACQGHALLQPEQSLILFQTPLAAPTAIDSNTGQTVPLPTWLQSLTQETTTRMDALTFSPNGEWLGYRLCTGSDTSSSTCSWKISRWQSGKTFDLLTLPPDKPQEGKRVDKLFFLSAKTGGNTDALPYSMMLLQSKHLPGRAYVWE